MSRSSLLKLFYKQHMVKLQGGTKIMKQIATKTGLSFFPPCILLSLLPSPVICAFVLDFKMCEYHSVFLRIKLYPWIYPWIFFFKESKENPRSRSLYFGTKGKELKLMEENIVVLQLFLHFWSRLKNPKQIFKWQESHCIEKTGKSRRNFRGE